MHSTDKRSKMQHCPPEKYSTILEIVTDSPTPKPIQLLRGPTCERPPKNKNAPLSSSIRAFQAGRSSTTCCVTQRPGIHGPLSDDLPPLREAREARDAQLRTATSSNVDRTVFEISDPGICGGQPIMAYIVALVALGFIKVCLGRSTKRR